MPPLISVDGLHKSFTLHLQGGVVLPVLRGASLDVAGGECLVVHGPSGAGKSTLLRLLHGNYRIETGRVRLMHDGAWLDLAAATPREILDMRRRTVGYVSQFLRVVPRIPALDLVMEPLIDLGVARDGARDRARAMLTRLNIPQRLWEIPPATFSGGEQQRINIARGFAADYPILLLDEPTAALDAENRLAVIALIEEAKARGAAVVGIFHDREVRKAVGTRVLTLNPYKEAA